MLHRNLNLVQWRVALSIDASMYVIQKFENIILYLRHSFVGFFSGVIKRSTELAKLSRILKYYLTEDSNVNVTNVSCHVKICTVKLD